MPIKVAHVVRQYYPSIGGMEDVVQNIARFQMEQNQHVPTVVTLNRLFVKPDEVLPAEDSINGIRVVRIPYQGSGRYPFSPGVLNHLRDCDVIHVHGIDFFYDYLAATKMIHRRPLVASTHGGFFHTAFASGLKKCFFNTVTRTSSLAYDRVVGTSDNDGHVFGRIIRKPKLTVIENGVNVEKYSDRAATELTPTIIYFGRWSENKGITDIIDWFAQLVHLHPQWCLIIAGREYDLTEAQLRTIVNSSGLAGRVHIAPNPSDAELSALMSVASYYACFSRHEGFGLAAIEAMSAGLMPVLSDIPPFRNLVEKSQLGVLHAGQSEITIAQLVAIHEAGQQAYVERREKLRAFASQYSWRHIAGRYVSIYEELAR